MRFNLKIFGHFPWSVFPLAMAAVALAAVIACGSEGPATTPTPTQPSGVVQPTETEGPSGEVQSQDEAPADAPTQEAQQEPSADDVQQAAAPTAGPTQVPQEGPPVDDGQQAATPTAARSEEHTSELQSRQYLVCRLLLEKKKI